MERICNNHSIICGCEMIANSTDLPDSDVLDTALTNYDLPAIAKYVMTNSVYDCLVGADYFIIYPRDSPTTHDKAIAMRKIAGINGTFELTVLLAKIQSSPLEDRMHLALQPQYFNQPVPSGTIVLNQGYPLCYKILNEITKQLKCSFWAIGDMNLPDLHTGKINLPMRLDYGFLCFYLARNGVETKLWVKPQYVVVNHFTRAPLPLFGGEDKSGQVVGKAN